MTYVFYKLTWCNPKVNAPSEQKATANAWNLQLFAAEATPRGRLTSNQATSLSQQELQQPG